MVEVLDAEAHAFAALLGKSANYGTREIGWSALATPEVEKVGPKGYIHGWIHVGAPGAGGRVFHPRHGHGTVSGLDEHGHAHIKFDSGKTRRFQHVEGHGAGHLMPRGAHPAGSDEFANHHAAAVTAAQRRDYGTAAKEYEQAGDAATHPVARQQMYDRADTARLKTPIAPSQSATATNEHLAAARAAHSAGRGDEARGHYRQALTEAGDRRTRANIAQEMVDGGHGKPRTQAPDAAERHERAAQELEQAHAAAGAVPVTGGHGAGGQRRAARANAEAAAAHRAEAARLREAQPERAGTDRTVAPAEADAKRAELANTKLVRDHTRQALGARLAGRHDQANRHLEAAAALEIDPAKRADLLDARRGTPEHPGPTAAEDRARVRRRVAAAAPGEAGAVSPPPAPAYAAPPKGDARQVVGQAARTVPSAAEVKDTLRQATSTDDAGRYIDSLGLKAPELRQLAREAGVPPDAGMSKAEVRRLLVETLVGRRLDGEAIRRRAGTPKGDGHTPGEGVATPALRTLGDEELADHFHQLSTSDRPDEARLQAALDEMDRRDTAARATSDRVDALVARGMPYHEAYAEVHGLDPAELDRQARNALVDTARRPGESREDTARRLYAEHVHHQALAAEAATQGHLLSAEGRAAGVDPVTLFSGPVARARKYGSEDLHRHWAQHPRQTYQQFRAGLFGRKRDREVAARTRLGANGRDFL